MPRRDTDEADGERGPVSPTEHLEAGARPQDLPVSAARDDHRPPEPGLGDGHHLRADGEGLRLPGRRGGLVQSPSPVLAGLDHHGGGVLHRPGIAVPSLAFTDVLLKAGIAISMDGKGSWRDNVFVERLWRSVKYEEVYLKAYRTVSEARLSIGRYLAFYNGRRPHSSLDRMTPDQAYFTRLPQIAAA